jgi:hypothetical protein
VRWERKVDYVPRAMGHETCSLLATHDRCVCIRTLTLHHSLIHGTNFTSCRYNTHVTSHPKVMVSHRCGLATRSKGYDYSLAETDGCDGKGKLTMHPMPRIMRHVRFLLHHDGRMHVPTLMLHHSLICGTSSTSR